MFLFILLLLFNKTNHLRQDLLWWKLQYTTAHWRWTNDWHEHWVGTTKNPWASKQMMAHVANYTERLVKFNLFLILLDLEIYTNRSSHIFPMSLSFSCTPSRPTWAYLTLETSTSQWRDFKKWIMWVFGFFNNYSKRNKKENQGGKKRHQKKKNH